MSSLTSDIGVDEDGKKCSTWLSNDHWLACESAPEVRPEPVRHLIFFSHSSKLSS